MKIESKAIISRRIRNLQRDIKQCRNNPTSFRMQVLYRQLAAAQIKLVTMKN